MSRSTLEAPAAVTRAGLVVFGAVLAAGCPSTMVPVDASDVLVRTDGPRDARDASDVAAPQTECNGVPVEDFDALAMRDGATYRYRGDNRAAPARPGRGLQPTAEAQRCSTGGTHQRIFRHRMTTNGILRITVDAPGTPYDFDTVIVASTGACGAASPYCNDDTVYADGSLTLRSTLTLLRESDSYRQPRAGTDVYFSVAGFPGSSSGVEQGPFELVVTEVPPTPNGEPCEDDLQCDEDKCDVVPGTDGQRRCRGFSLTCDDAVCFDTCAMCTAGMTCVLSNGCCTVIDRRADETCGRFVRCGTGLSCAYRPDFDANGSGVELHVSRCTPIGARWADCRDGGQCDPGLSCGVIPGAVNAVCRPARASGERCHVLYDACPTGESCVAEGFDGCAIDTAAVPARCTAHESVRFEGVCRPLGSAGAPCPTGSCAHEGLVCSSDSTGLCSVPLPLGSPCVPPAVCVDGACAYTWMTQSATCIARGAPGAPCTDGDGVCAAGGRCVAGRCVVTVASGDTCAIGRACASGDACVPDEDGRAGRCVPRGQEGGFCRYGAQRCDAGLVCSNDVASYGLCQRRVQTTCRPNRGTDRCPDGRVCGATNFTTGNCVVPVLERERNDEAFEAQSVTLPAAITGRLQLLNADCFAFELARGGAVYAQATRPFGHVNVFNRWQLSLWSYDAGGGARELGRARGGLELSGVLPRLDGLGSSPVRNPFAAGLAPGRYAVCLVLEHAASELPIDNDYVLSITAEAP